MSEIFLSYKKEDRARAAPLVAALEAEGFSVWWDQHIEVGANWRDTITSRLHEARCVIVLWSRESVGSAGRFVHDEASRAEKRGAYLPVMIDPVELPLGFGHTQALSLVGWRGDRQAPDFQNLLAAARAMIAGEAPPKPALRPARRSPAPSRRLLIGGAALAAAGAAGLILAPRSVRCRIGLCWGGAPPASIAVLAFRNLSGDPKQEYLSDGVSEDIRDALARIPSIKVAARTSSDAISDAHADVATIAAKLDVAYVLDGSVRRSADTVRVTAALVEAKTGFERWSQSYDRDVKDIMAVQSGIATSVAETIKGKLLGAEAVAVARPPTAVPAAYDAFLRGRQLLDLSGDEATYREALRQFDAAIAADPAYAAAYAARARTLVALANQFEPADRLRATYDAALVSARRAVALAPDLAEAQSTLGYTLTHARLDFAGAQKPYERSLQAGPNDADVLIDYGQFAARMGRSQAGLAALAKAVSLDPLNPRTYKAQAVAYYQARRYADAIATMRHAIDLSPKMNSGHATIGDSLLMLGRTAEARDEYAREPQDFSRLTGLAIAEARVGHQAAAKAAFEALTQSQGDSAAYQRAQILAQWGDTTGALNSLEAAHRVGDAGLEYLLTDPLLDPLRREPRFIALLAALGLRA